MDDDTLDRLLAGDLDRLPELPKRVVRLFISSTFTDMTLERNSLMERVYPRLKKYCRERHGLDFQVVDMRWGVRDEATDDHQTVNLCRREIDNCQRVSLGPNFVALIGDKYGFRPLLNRIKSTEFRSLRRCLIESDINTDFLDTWYKEDLNAVPAEHLLQPISSILKNFTNKNEPELQMVDQRIWQAIQERLHDLLLIGSSRLVQQGRMSEREQALKYSISVTEREVLEGCLDLNEPKLHCLVYVRSIVDLRDHLARYFEDLARINEGPQHQLDTPGDGMGGGGHHHPTRANGVGGGGEAKRDSASLKIGEDTISLATSNAQTAPERRLERQRRLMGKYIDLTSKSGDGWQVDEEAQEALTALKEVKLKSKLAANGRNLTIHQVHWNDQDGVSMKSEEHKQYLNSLTEHFYQNLTRMIRSAVKSERSRVETKGLIGEVLQHSHYSLQVGRRVHSRTNELDQIRAYIVTGSCQGSSGSTSSGAALQSTAHVLPMFLYGVSGSGKTSVLARAATLARDWIKQARSRRRSSSVQADQLLRQSAGSNRAQEQPSDRWDRKPCIITRFCCTTPASSSMVGMLTSVCRQLQYNFYQFGPLNGLLDQQAIGPAATAQAASRRAPESPVANATKRAATEQLAQQAIPEDFVRLVYTFRQLLDNCRHSLHRRRMFVIIVDSIERLSSPAECTVDTKFSWLTSLARLPSNVRLIVSCGSSAANADDFLHLKRHFLLAHYRLHRAAGGSLSSSTAADQDDKDEEDELEPSTSRSSSSLSCATQAHEQSISKFQLLRPLVLPVARLARGSRAFAFDGGGHPAGLARGDSRPPRQMVAFAESITRQSQVDGDSDRELPRASSSESLQSNRRGPASRTFAATGLLHIRPLGPEVGQAVLRRWLAESGRSLTQQQWSIVERSLGQCSRPIFVKLAFGEVINWKSYSMQGDTEGFTFGSAWLSDLALGDGANQRPALCSQLERLLRRAGGNAESEAPEFKWQMLAMEQQWLNYLDYCSRRSLAVGDSASVGSAAAHISRIWTPGAKEGDDPQQAKGSVSIAATKLAGSGGAGGPATSVCRLSNTIEEAICQLLARIELQHGHLLTKHSLSYITAARNGICENELEDVLSLDDVVLDDVFQYHLPPVRRIPPLLWTRIRNDLPDYLSERDADGIVITWHHGQFRTVTQSRYLADSKQLVYIHSLLADYFLGKWVDKPKPFRCTKQQVQMAAEQLESAIQQSMRRDSEQASGGRLGGSGSAGARTGASFSLRNRLRSSDHHDQRLQWMQAKAHRRVPHQPLYYEAPASDSAHRDAPAEATSGASATQPELDQHQQEAAPQRQAAPVRRRYNLRKLTELPHHLMRSGRFLELAAKALFNYRWLFASIDALGLQSLFADLAEARHFLELELAERSEQANGSSHEPQDQDQFASGVAPRDHLAGWALESLIEQLAVLSGTLRLSSGVIHSNPHMLAPQLVGRMLPVALEFKERSRASESADARSKTRGGGGSSSAPSPLELLGQLLEQCDRDGGADCSLLPTDHCLQSAEGLQLGSLEGHPFGVMAMCMAADGRHLLAVSSKFIMWNIATGEIARDIDPELDGAIMKGLVLSGSGQFALAHSSDNLVLLLELPTQQVARCDLKTLMPTDGRRRDELVDLKLIDQREASRCFVWTRSGLLVVLKMTLAEHQENEPGSSSARDSQPQAAAISIGVDYELNLVQLGGARRTLEVSIEQISQSVDLVSVTSETYPSGVGWLHFATLRVCRSAGSPGALVGGFVSSNVGQLRPILIELSDSNRQLVCADASGCVWLSRRRAASWSSAKLLLDAGSGSKSELLAIELEASPTSQTGGGGASDAAGPRDDHLRASLAEFEREIDAECGEIEPIRRVFSSHNHDNGSHPNPDPTASLAESSPGEQVQFVKLYECSRIVILLLARVARSGNGVRPHQPERKCLVLPRDVRNVGLHTNRSHLTSRVTLSRRPREHHLIVAANRKLLVYSIEAESLLKCIEAHASRITRLLPISSLGPGSQSSPVGANWTPTASRGPQQLGSALATCSLDRTVKLWNLLNMDKEEHAIDRVAGSSSGGRQFDSIHLHSQLPVAACLARGQLSLWDWRTSKLIRSFESSAELEPRRRTSGGGARNKSRTNSALLTVCKFSSNGRYLAVATSQAEVHLVSVDGSKWAGHDSNAGTAKTEAVGLEPISSLHLQARESQVLSLRFMAQDSRLLVVSKCSSGSVRAGSSSSSSSSTAEDDATLTDDGNHPQEDEEQSHLVCRLCISCWSVPESRRLYSVECPVPKRRRQQDSAESSVSQYLSRLAANSELHRPHRRHHQQSMPSLNKEASRLVALTCDQQFLVVVVARGQTASPKAPTADRALGRRSSAATRLQLDLNVYSTRDGQLAKTIDLSRVETVQVQPQPEARARENKAAGHSALLQVAADRSQKSSAQTEHGHQQQASVDFISIGADQCSRLKAVVNRDRASIVALIDDERGSSFFLDVGTKLLAAYSNSWVGRTSSDGRYGLSRMFAGTSATSGAAHISARPAGGSGGGDSFTSGGLKLLEMRHCRPLKSLLTLEQLNSLIWSASEASTGVRAAGVSSQQSDTICGFTKPNDAYVYFCDLRQRRLLLVRLRDSQLIANYKLSSPVSRIKCSSDGLALVLGQTDGSLCSLAIADPQWSDTLARLAQYPSRRQLAG